MHEQKTQPPSTTNMAEATATTDQRSIEELEVREIELRFAKNAGCIEIYLIKGKLI